MVASEAYADPGRGVVVGASGGWRMVHEGVEVRLARRPETDETVILCRSADRRAKEQAMHGKFSRRIETALERLAVRVASSKKRLDPAKVNCRIGRILQQNQRAAARFSIVLEPDGCPAGLRLAIACNASFDDGAALSEAQAPRLLKPRRHRHVANPAPRGFWPATLDGDFCAEGAPRKNDPES